MDNQLNIYSIEETNNRLSFYVEVNCTNCYARVEEDGRVHLDDKFKIRDLKVIMLMLDEMEKIR